MNRCRIHSQRDRLRAPWFGALVVIFSTLVGFVISTVAALPVGAVATSASRLNASMQGSPYAYDAAAQRVRTLAFADVPSPTASTSSRGLSSASGVLRAPDLVVVAPKIGSGSGPWTEGVTARPGGAVAQSAPGSCVSACGQMLTGGARSQADLLGSLGEWSNPQALARELGEGWTGGFFGSADDALAAAGRGPMGATLQAGAGPGHMVVTSPLQRGGFLVRDPWGGGSTYEVGADWISRYVSGGVFR